MSVEIEGCGQRAGLTERTALAGETGEFDLEDYTGAIWTGQGVDGTLHVAAVGIRALGESSIGQSGLVDGSDRVVVDDCSISKFLGEVSRQVH